MAMKAFRPFFIAVLLAAIPAAMFARTPATAHATVQNWTARHSHPFGRVLGRPTGRVLTAVSNGTNLFHSVALSGGGFAVVADRDAALLAFADTGEFTATNAAPLWTMLLADTGATTRKATRGPRLCRGTSDAPVLPDGVSVTQTIVTSAPRLLTASVSLESSLDDLRVSPLMQTKWDQKSGIYNYYTPGHVYCGCVATAMAQIMRYHEYPTASVTAKTKACTYNSTITNLTMQGGLYDWSSMPYVPSTANKQAIGKLTSDAGISVHMNYASGGSGAFVIMAAKAFTNTWNYAQSQHWSSSNDGTSADGYLNSTVLENTILANLDAGYPCLLGIGDDGDVGHAIVADGYGYLSAQRYIHLNMGWSGSSNYWYYFPVNAGGYTFTYLDEVIYNLFPDKTGNIISGRVTDKNGVALAGATVTYAGKATVSSSSSGGGWFGGSSSGKKTIALSGSTTTSDTGVYSFLVTNATVSITNLTVSLPGYYSATTSGITTAISTSYYIAESYLDDDPTDCRYYTPPATVGNSWGNDLVLAAYYIPPSFTATPVISTVDGTVTFVTSATAGTQWALQWNDDLTDENGWDTLTTFTATGAAQILEISSDVIDWAVIPTAFFRLMAL